MVPNLTNIPEELRSVILGSRSFSLCEVAAIAQTSQQLNREVYQFVTNLQPEFGEINVISPEEIAYFPRLVTCSYVIIIATLDQLADTAQHPALKVATVDLTVLLKLLKVDPEYPIIGDNGETLGDNGDIILYFLRYYLTIHSINGITFNFILDEDHVSIGSNWICFPDKTYNEWIFSFVGTYNAEISPIIRYVGPLIPEDVINPRDMVITIFFDSPLYDYNTSRINIPALGRYLTSFPDLVSLALYPLDGMIREAMNRQSSLLGLSNYRFPKITYLDLPIQVSDLPTLHRVFPNVKEPLLSNNFSFTEKDILQALPIVPYLSRLRLNVHSNVRHFQYRGMKREELASLLPIPLQEDDDNSYDQFPC